SRVPPSGGRSITISQCVPGSPQTVAGKSPCTEPVPSTSKPRPTKNAVATSRSETVRPTWSKRRTCAMGSILRCCLVRLLLGRSRCSDLDIPRPRRGHRIVPHHRIDELRRAHRSATRPSDPSSPDKHQQAQPDTPSDLREHHTHSRLTGVV